MRWRAGLVALLFAHVLWCVGRIPHAVGAKRTSEVAEFRAQGDAEYLLARNGLNKHGAEVIRQLQAHTPSRCAVLFTGEAKGALEFAAALLWPRLLILEKDSRAIDGYPFARGTLDGKEGELVLRATHDDLALELRK